MSWQTRSRRRFVMALAFEVVLGTLPASAGGAAKVASARLGPLAVIPFKNLNADPALEWLSAGVAETMVADLKKSGRVRLVERSQLASAMTEISLQGLSGSDPSTAVKVGKMVGAKAVVVGSYQVAGHTLRFVARMVEVSTGIISKSAKVTGPRSKVFALQDQIVSRLLGVKVVRRRRVRQLDRAQASKLAEVETPSAGSANTPRLEAYRLYAMSLSVASDADKLPWLKQAVAADPEFEYAQDELSRLERLLASHETRRRMREAEKLRVLREEALGSEDPVTRYSKTMMLLGQDTSQNEYRQLLEDAAKIKRLPWPLPKGWPKTTASPKQLAEYFEILAHQVLVHEDKVLSLGEQFLDRYPDSAQFDQVVSMMKRMVELQRQHEDDKLKYPPALEKVETQNREREARAAKRGLSSTPLALARQVQRRCSVAARFRQWAQVIKECGALIERFSSYEGAKNEGEKNEKEKAKAKKDLERLRSLLTNSRVQILWANYHLGQFATARSIHAWLLLNAPEYSRQHDLKDQTVSWPR